MAIVRKSLPERKSVKSPKCRLRAPRLRNSHDLPLVGHWLPVDDGVPIVDGEPEADGVPVVFVPEPSGSLRSYVDRLGRLAEKQ